MKALLLTLLIISLNIFAATEEEHAVPWCIAMNGVYERVDTRLPDGTYPDCITYRYIIEVDKVGNYYEGVGQVLHYWREDGFKRIPVLALIVDKTKSLDLKKLQKAKEVAENNCPRITVMVIDKII